MNLIRLLAATALAGAAGLAFAQGAVSPAKKELVQKALRLQQPAFEGTGNALANQTATTLMQLAGQAIARLPADKREAVAAELQADVRKFYDEIAPLLRAGAVKLAPSTFGTALEEKLSEDELKVLITWLESPVNKKYAQLAGETQQALGQKLMAETRPQIEPKLKALEQQMGARLIAAGGGAQAPASAPKPAAGPAAAPKKP